MDITQLIGSYGFPIVMCITMAWYVKYTGDQNRNDLLQLNELHRDAETKITEAVNNNTIVMTKLCEKMEGVKTEENESNN